MHPLDALSIAASAASCLAPTVSTSCTALALAFAFAALRLELFRRDLHTADDAREGVDTAAAIAPVGRPHYYCRPDCGDALLADASEDTLRLPRVVEWP